MAGWATATISCSCCQRRSYLLNLFTHEDSQTYIDVDANLAGDEAPRVSVHKARRLKTFAKQEADQADQRPAYVRACVRAWVEEREREIEREKERYIKKRNIERENERDN